MLKKYNIKISKLFILTNIANIISLTKCLLQKAAKIFKIYILIPLTFKLVHRVFRFSIYQPLKIIIKRGLEKELDVVLTTIYYFRNTSLTVAKFIALILTV